MIRMVYLKSNDKISVVMPSSGSEEDLKNAILGLKNLFNNKKIELLIDDKLAKNGIDTFSANTTKFRVQSFIDAAKDPETSVIWTFRGGYGAGKLLEYLEKELPKDFNKTLIGFSDITFLHIMLHNKFNIPSFHAPTLSKLLNNETPDGILNEIFDVLFGKQNKVEFDLTTIFNPNLEKEISGITEGSNLEIVRCTIGTKWQVDCYNKILFLEDVGDNAYRYDRAFYHFINSQAAKGLKAIVIGKFSCIDEEKNIEDKLISGFKDYVSIPIFRSEEFGHIPGNRIIPLNTKALIKISNNKAKLSIETS
jgi:muramoyltetrapeptide carboxypeptidase